MKISRHIAFGVAIVFVPLVIGIFFRSIDRNSESSPQESGREASDASQKGAAKNTTANKPALFDWKILKSYDVKTGKMSSGLQELNNEYIRIPGFVVPLEDNSGRMTEFLLVPSQMSCIHVPPPPPNFIFYVHVENKAGVEVPMGPIWLTGQLFVGKGELRGESYFLRINAINVEPYRAEGR